MIRTWDGDGAGSALENEKVDESETKVNAVFGKVTAISCD
jgi:hypothetical protein